MGPHAGVILGRTRSVRLSEWILAVFFTYTTVLALVLPIPAEMRIRTILANLAVLGAYALWALLNRKWSPTAAIVRDILPLALMLLAYKEMGWFAPPTHDFHLENAWIVWDRLLLNSWGLKPAFEALGPVIPSLLEISYSLVYALPLFTVVVLHLHGRQKLVDSLLVIYLLGLFLSYVQFPFWPSEPPRTVFAGQDLPSTLTVFRKFNLALLGSQGIHTSVFPSAHVSGAFAAAFAMRRLMADVPCVRWGVLLYAILVTLATVYGRYHYAVDGLAGLGVAVVADVAGAALLRHRSPASIAAPLPRAAVTVSAGGQ